MLSGYTYEGGAYGNYKPSGFESDGFFMSLSRKTEGNCFVNNSQKFLHSTKKVCRRVIFLLIPEKMYGLLSKMQRILK